MAQTVKKNLPATPETWSLIPGQEDLSEELDSSLQYSCLDNSMDEGALWAIIHEIAKGQLSK